jgi:diguanylate cyclase (GGDEF)-like protein
MASNNDGYWSEAHAAFRLDVVPPPWRTSWAVALYLLTGVGIVGGYFRTQSKKLEREMAQRRELQIQVELRTRELAQKNSDLETVNRRLAQASLTDTLTGLKNRRYLYEHIEAEVAALDRLAVDRMRAPGESNAVDIAPGLFFMMIDLDGFKAINDTYGHHAGDVALVQVRDILHACCRKSDTVIRWGGDEFLIVGHPGGKLGAERLAERIRTVLAEHQFQLGGGHVGRLSGSIGIAMYPFFPAKPTLVSWEQVSAIADQASYVAKQTKRNAWVGIYANAKSKGIDRFDNIKMNLESFVEQGVLDISTSIEGPLALSDKRGQQNRG